VQGWKTNDSADLKKYLFYQPAKKKNANAHLAHLQAPEHRLIPQLAKEPNFCQHSTRMINSLIYLLKFTNELIYLPKMQLN
jgi:hypothetical protein